MQFSGKGRHVNMFVLKAPKLGYFFFFFCATCMLDHTLLNRTDIVWISERKLDEIGQQLIGIMYSFSIHVQLPCTHTTI